MIITKACIDNIDDIISIIDQAKTYLKSNNINQWQDGYPNKETFINDINNDCLYLVKEDNTVLSVFALTNYDGNYDVIYDGKWHSDKAYVAVHRIAIDDKFKGRGVAKYIFDYVKDNYSYIRVDTHKDNLSMQKCLLKNGFKYCGIIYLSRDNSSRLAYDFIDDKE